MSLNPRIHYWQGRRVWLVGASSGIGRATAALLHARGAQVIVSARNAQALQAFVDEHPGSVAVPLDTAHTAQVKAAALAGRLNALATPTPFFSVSALLHPSLPRSLP